MYKLAVISSHFATYEIATNNYILIESTDRQICIKFDEQVKILAVGNPRKVSCVNYCRVIMCWRVDILMAISLLVRRFSDEMTLNPCSSLWNQLLFQTR